MRERTRQQMPGPAHSSIFNQPANLAAGDPLAAQLHFRINLDLESHLAPELGQQIHVARSFMPEAKVVAFVNFARVQFSLQNAFRKLPRRHKRKIAPEGQQQHGVNSRAFEPAQFLGSRGEQFQSGFRPQNARRMRLERNRDRLAPTRPRPRNNFLQHMRMRPVNAVKIPHADQAGPKPEGTSSSLWKTCIVVAICDRR